MGKEKLGLADLVHQLQQPLKRSQGKSVTQLEVALNVNHDNHIFSQYFLNEE
ncbi:hypothetical protein IQ238_07040 [Pleurocapsales cyanobacterium LEGE 06147]|nr:hypothetical protein [Pleurocapsales cyanobacterium LEGE 06147]